MVSEVARGIRSFTLRSGRVSEQRRALFEQNVGNFCIDFDGEKLFDLSKIFGNAHPVTVEIGFGMGDSPFFFAQKYPNFNLLAIEVHLPGVARLISLLNQHRMSNVRIIRHDAVEILKKGIADNQISAFHIYFPDPWPKKKHHKRRLVQNQLVDLLTDKLLPGGYICCATDWEEYGIEMHQLFEKNSRLTPRHEGGYCERPDFRPMTPFERKGLNQKHRIINLIYDKN